MRLSRAIIFGVIALALAAWFVARQRRDAIPHQPSTATKLSQATLTAEAALTNWQQSNPTAISDLRGKLAALPRAEVAAAIRRFLDSGKNAPTGQGFRIDAKGFLEESPTLRTFLLDYLGQIDPAAAAQYAKTILASKDSPDEWAVALRNLALGDSSAEGRTLLRQKTDELLRCEPWQTNPSVGYLEAFDTAVYLGGTNFVPPLTDLVRRKDNQAVAHAAFLTLDRLVINEPAAMLDSLAADPSLMEGREQTRANYLARADARDQRQTKALEKYLLDPRTSASELDQFAGLFPNANFMISRNLLTPSPTLDHADLSGRDAASLQLVQQWLADPRF